MTKMQRFKKILVGLLMLVCCAVLIAEPDLGLYIVALILCVSMLVYGIRCLILYFTMARHMVGGASILYKGIIVLDLAIFTLCMVDDPHMYIMLYLLGMHAFAGVMDILLAMEARRFGAPAWKQSLGSGIVNLAVAVSAVVAVLFLHSTTDLVYIYAGCLFYSACSQFISAFQKTAIVYIQ